MSNLFFALAHSFTAFFLLTSVKADFTTCTPIQLCPAMSVVPANPNLNDGKDFFVYNAGVGAYSHSYGFGANVFYLNSATSLMAPACYASSSCSVHFGINGGTWRPTDGSLHININIYSAPDHAALIGSGTITSNNFTALCDMDQYGKPVWYAGGPFELSYTITSGCSGDQFPCKVGTTSAQVYFQHANSMGTVWPQEPTFTNSVINISNASPFEAPLFNTNSSQNFVDGTPYSSYTVTTYSAVLALWGSTNYTTSSGSFNPDGVDSIGMDFAAGLQCASATCDGCTEGVVSGQCSAGVPQTVRTAGNCVTVVRDNAVPCAYTTTVV